MLTKSTILAVTEDLVFVTIVARFIYHLYWLFTRFLPGATAYTRHQTLGAGRHAPAVVHWQQYVKALYRRKLLIGMLLSDDSKHPEHELKLYSVHSLADGIRIIFPVTFPFIKPLEFDIVYDSNLGCL